VEEILEDVHSAEAGGAKDVVLTGVHLGSWGLDFDDPQRLADLVTALLAETSIPRLRISSLEPWDLDGNFFHLWQDGRLCRHLHLPLQSGSASVLRRMRRKTSPESFAALVQRARQQIPDLAITTDIITGFPGESEAEFAETLAFVRTMDFSGGHVFTYSARPGTPAARMKGQIRGDLSHIRSAILRETLEESAQTYRKKFLGRRLTVLWESTSKLSDSGWQIEGLTDTYVRVKATAPEPRWNQMEDVVITEELEDGLAGVIAP
jgi:threonylcarbamoyladenosine tRNA methylthiotransferase MtaB